MSKRVRRLETNIENKFVDYAINAQAMSNSGTPDLLNALSQGDTAQTRVGGRITMTSCALRYTVKRDGADASFLVALVYDRESHFSLATMQAVYDIATAPAADKTTALLDRTHRGRFQVLCSERGMVTTDQPWYVGSFFKDFTKKGRKGLDVKFEGNAGDDGDIQKGSLIFFSLTSQTTSNFPTLTFISRTRYNDV